MRILAKDNGLPVPRTDTTVLVVTVRRNLNAPVFDQLSYTATIPDSTSLGSSVLTVSARDDDYKVQFYVPFHQTFLI